MFTLSLDNPEYYRVKSGQTAEEIERVKNIPAIGVFAGKILPADAFIVHKVQPFETYESISHKYGADKAETERANGFKPLYPSCRLFVPVNNPQSDDGI